MDPRIEDALTAFTAAAKRVFGERLRTVLLFGSAAEDRLRATSDVNVLVVLRAFDPSAAESFRDDLRLARTAIDLRPLFVLESEFPAARELFAVRFGDVERRRRVLFGEDPFRAGTAPRAARIFALRQALLNLTMRLRERFLSLSEDAHPAALASFAGALRAAAAEWFALRDGTAPVPREALLRAAREFGDAHDVAVVHGITAIREGGAAPPDVARDGLLRLARLTARLLDAAEGLRP